MVVSITPRVGDTNGSRSSDGEQVQSTPRMGRHILLSDRRGEPRFQSTPPHGEADAEKFRGVEGGRGVFNPRPRMGRHHKRPGSPTAGADVSIPPPHGGDLPPAGCSAPRVVCPRAPHGGDLQCHYFRYWKMVQSTPRMGDYRFGEFLSASSFNPRPRMRRPLGNPKEGGDNMFQSTPPHEALMASESRMPRFRYALRTGRQGSPGTAGFQSTPLPRMGDAEEPVRAQRLRNGFNPRPRMRRPGRMSPKTV